MSIYTRTGDKGETSLLSGQRVSKDDLRVEAYGTLDELNSLLGLAACWCRNQRVREIIGCLQDRLFLIGAELASGDGIRVPETPVNQQDWRLQEEWIDKMVQELPKLRNFVLPGGSAGAAALQVARAVCRRAERLTVRLQREHGKVNPHLLIYINRLSDLLFTMARYENLTEGHGELVWRGGR